MQILQAASSVRADVLPNQTLQTSSPEVSPYLTIFIRLQGLPHCILTTSDARVLEVAATALDQASVKLSGLLQAGHVCTE